MSLARCIFALFLVFSAAYAATFGTVTPIVGGAADIVLDEARARLYLINTNRNQVEVYSIPQRRFLNPITVDEMPLGAAMSRSGKMLYVASHAAASLMIIDADTLQVVNRVALPARPEGVAVGFDERVLISTIGTGQNNLFNVLLIYDPAAGTSSQAISSVPVAPPPPASPLLPQQAFGRPLLANRSFLQATRDGRFIFGVNIPNAAARAVFVYEADSGTVLRSRTVAGVSQVISVAPDASKFMAGLHLFDAETLNVLAQQNAANAPYPFPTGTNFNLQQNQGGSVWAPDGSVIYSAFNVTPVQNPPARPNISQLMISDPENLLIHTALQLPENLAGRIVISSDGGNAYALSDSGFLSLPLSNLPQSPIAMAPRTALLVANDQCGVTAPITTSRAEVENANRGRINATAQLIPQAPTGPPGLGGAGGPGGGLPGGGAIIVITPVPGRGEAGGAAGGAAQANITNSAPRMRTTPTAQGVAFDFTYNPVNRGIGTVSPIHQYSITSNEAVNLPPAITVYQNNRNSENRGDIAVVDVSLTPNEGLLEIEQDTARQMLYIANSGLNRVEVFDMRRQQFLAPIKVGQLPSSVSISVDGQTLYVANRGGESISMIDLPTRTVVGRVRFPALPFNNNAAIVTPQGIVSTQRGPLVIMSNGTLWRVIGNEAVPRRFNANVLPVANNTQILAAPRTMAASPNGDFALVLAGNGSAYIYDAAVDDFIQGRQITTGQITGYFGPVAVGPRGQYYIVNGNLLSPALTPVAAGPGTAPGAPTRPVSAVASVGATTYARLTQAPIPNAAALAALTEAGSVEIVSATTGATMRSAPALERPLSTPTGNVRANLPGRTMVVDGAGTTAYMLTASGLSIVPLAAPLNPATRPTINPGGVVNLASYRTEVAQGGLISIFGRNLGESSMADGTPLPTVLGGTCVTLNNVPMPLFMTTTGQINAQIPPSLAPGRYPMVVRYLTDFSSSLTQQITVSRYAPAVFVDPTTNQAAIFHADGRPVTKDNPARRDRRLVLYATGLGPTRGGEVLAGQPAPSDPLAVTERLQVFFGDPTINGSEIIVEWSGLVPGYIGLYQANLYVPGVHLRGDALPVTLRIGNVNSPSTAPVNPVVAVQ